MKKNSNISKLLSTGNGIFVSVIILAIFLIFASIAVPNVFQTTNIANVLQVNSPSGIMAIGLALVLLTGEIDISVGAVMSLSVMVISKIIDYSEPLAIVAMIGVGAACGFLNGWIVAKVKVPSLMVTIGTMSIFSGLASIITNAQAKFMTSAYPIFTTLSKGDLGGIPVTFVICLILAVLFWIITSKTKFGKDIYYTGANKRAAWMSGIRIDHIKIIVFIICGILAALAGPRITTQIGRSNSDAGTGQEVTAIAIAVLGGVSLDGGRGSILGVLCGMVTMGILMNMLALSGLGTYVEMAIKGILIIAVVFIYGLVNRKTGILKEA